MKSKEKATVFGNVKVMVCGAIFVAMSIVFGKYLPLVNVDVLRFSLENLPILMAGVLFGPAVGTAVGVVADLVGCFLVGYAINPFVTLGAALIGCISGLGAKLFTKGPLWARLMVSVFGAHLLGSVVVKTLGLATYYNWPLWQLMLMRLLNYVLLGAAEFAILFLLLRNKTLMAQLQKMTIKRSAKKGGPSMTYEEALSYIHSVSWKGSRPGLERIRELMDKLGNPQNSLRYVHVAGTNGKGSFCAMLGSVLGKSGIRYGSFTSPYVRFFNERMAIDGMPISNEELAEVTAYVKPYADAMADAPTEFELITAIAFVYFARHGCDVVILEAGMGGRLDSTNVIERSLLSVITGIALDHTAYLGDTPELIAAEKAGIIKHGCPILFGGGEASVEKVIADRAMACDAPFFTVDHTKVVRHSYSLRGIDFDFGSYRGLHVSLVGEYQLHNAAIVLSAIDILRDRGLALSENAVREGLAEAKWPARFEQLSTDPIVIFDGAHNPQGMTACAASITACFPDQKVLILTGVMKDKDYHGMIDTMKPFASAAFTVTPNNPRALDAATFAKAFGEEGIEATAFATVEEALRTAYERAKNENRPLIALGSLYMYEEFMNAFERLHN